MTAALAIVSAFVATLIRRNVQPLFRPWFVKSEGAVFLGAVVGAPHFAPYVDLYLTRKGEILARMGNAESDYGCLGTIGQIAQLPPDYASAYRFGARLAARYQAQGARYVPSAWDVDTRAPESDQEPAEPPTCSICDGLGHGYPGGGPCPLEETGEREHDRYGYLS